MWALVALEQQQLLPRKWGGGKYANNQLVLASCSWLQICKGPPYFDTATGPALDLMRLWR